MENIIAQYYCFYHIKSNQFCSVAYILEWLYKYLQTLQEKIFHKK